MAAVDAEMDVPKVEGRRHAAYWRNFVRFLTLGALGAAVVLILMAIFLL